MKRPRNLDQISDCAQLGYTVLLWLEFCDREETHHVNITLRLGQNAWHCAIGWPDVIDVVTRTDTGAMQWNNVKIIVDPLLNPDRIHIERVKSEHDV